MQEVALDPHASEASSACLPLLSSPRRSCPFAGLAILVTWDTRGATWFARRLWAPTLLWVAGTRVEVEGAERVDPRRPTLYASNHQSSIDIPVLFVALPVNLRFIAKEQLRWVPLVGWYLQMAGHILIDRSNRTRAIASLDRAAVESPDEELASSSSRKGRARQTAASTLSSTAPSAWPSRPASPSSR